VAGIETSVIKGGDFLFHAVSPDHCLTPEEFTDEQKQVAAATDAFVEDEILPRVGELEEQKPGLTRELLRKAGTIGLLSVRLPEEYGGISMDTCTDLLVAEHMAKYGSFSATFGAHTTIGMLPILYFGTDLQKKEYLPRMASGEMIAAYCLTEAHAGSDALASRTNAVLSSGGANYTLNGEKMWITNGNLADIFTIFAKVAGSSFTAFIVERGFRGLKTGIEEKKMGISGSSTCSVILDNVEVPIKNLLGGIGRGHLIAFNILNIGRLKLAASCTGSAKHVNGIAIRYALGRKAFGKTIASFGLIQHKIAEMAIRTFVAESMVYRTAGLIDSRLASGSSELPNTLRIIDEFAAECSMVKVFVSEALDYVVDEAVQIHGGYGFHKDFAVERAYRDSRINRIFEGTNEINRLLTSRTVLKRVLQRQLPKEAVMQAGYDRWPIIPVMDDEALAEEKNIIAGAKWIALSMLKIALEDFQSNLEDQQELLAGISDIMMETYAMESAVLRAHKMRILGSGSVAGNVVSVYTRDAAMRIEGIARTLLATVLHGDQLQGGLATLAHFRSFGLVDSIRLRRQIAEFMLAAGKYKV
jgi:alkylation response protein AidB-like acyl-CoA dehydrogenase